MLYEILYLGSSEGTQEVERNTRIRLVFPLHFFRAIAASYVFYNRTEHSRGFFIFNQNYFRVM